MIASTVCYIAAALLLGTATSLIFCVLLGVSTAMLWPGTLIFMEENIPAVGVAAYAIMAAGGDLGASIAPQGLGVIVDLASLSKWAENLGVRFSLSAEQIGFRFGMLLAAIFPLLGVVLLLLMRRYFKKYSLRRADEIETK